VAPFEWRDTRRSTLCRCRSASRASGWVSAPRESTLLSSAVPWVFLPRHTMPGSFPMRVAIVTTATTGNAMATYPSLPLQGSARARACSLRLEHVWIMLALRTTWWPQCQILCQERPDSHADWAGIFILGAPSGYPWQAIGPGGPARGCAGPPSGACHALTALRRGRGEAPRRGGGPSREFQTLLQHYDPQRPSVHNLSCVSKLVMRSEGRGERRKTKPSASISRIATPPNFALREACSVARHRSGSARRSHSC
jgi:hypothetical protein